MNAFTRHTNALLVSITFPGLSDEQELLATLASENPAANPRLRQRAKALLQLNEGATPEEVIHATHTTRRGIQGLVERFRLGGLYAALLGLRASAEWRVWLALSPESAPHVRLKSPSQNSKRAIDSGTASAIPEPAAARLSSRKQVGCTINAPEAHPHHHGGRTVTVRLRQR